MRGSNPKLLPYIHSLYYGVLTSVGVVFISGVLSISPLGHKEFFAEVGIGAFFTAGALALVLGILMYKDGKIGG